MADHWVRLGMAIVIIAFVSFCLHAAGIRGRTAEPGVIGIVYRR